MQFKEIPTLSKETVEKHELPIDAHRMLLIERVKSNQSTIVVGETGSGKTTRMPIFLLEEFPNSKIIVTSPRVLPARSVSKYVATQRGNSVGKEIGLITREFHQTSRETRATFMTDGILLSLLKKDPLLEAYDIVMVDEAHERTINIDLSLGLLKQAQVLRKEKNKPELKIIVASATIEEQKFADYFEGTPVAKVPGRMYPVDVNYYVLTNKEEGFISSIKASVEVTKQIHDSGKEGDILIFMPGEDEIKRTIEELGKVVDTSEVTVLPLYGAMNPQDQDAIFAKNSKRKIIVSTNIAETSVTIDGVCHVVDSTYLKQKNYNPETGIHSLETIEASQANMNQRTGRAGRTAPGTCYRLISYDDFERRSEFQKPEILRSDLAEVVLRMKDMGIKDVEGFDFIDNPSRSHIHSAVTILKNLGALDKEQNITDTGREMMRLQLRPDLSRMLIEAKHIGCVEAMVDLCSIMSASKQVFIAPKKENGYIQDPEIARQFNNQQSLRILNSDPLTLLNVWSKWEESKFSREFAYNHLLNAKSLNEIGLIRTHLLKTLAEGGIEVSGEKSQPDKIAITKCLLVGAPESLFIARDFKRRFYEPASDVPYLSGTQIFPGSSLFMNGGNIIMAMHITKSSKDKETRYGLEKNTSLYARICQNLTIEELEKIIPEAITKKKVMTPQLDTFTGNYYQIYSVYLHGKSIGEKRIELEDGSMTLEDIYGSNSNIVASLLPFVSSENKLTFDTYRDLELRSVGGLSPLNIDGLYGNIIKKYNIKKKEELQNHENDFIITLSNLVSHEDMDRIEKDSPREIQIGGRVFPIKYRESYIGSGMQARIEVSDEDVDVLIEHKDSIPQLTYAKLVFIYSYGSYDSIDTLEKMRKDYNAYSLGLHEPRHSPHESLVSKPVPTTTLLGDLLKEKLESTSNFKGISQQTVLPTLIQKESKPVEKIILTQEKKEEIKNTISEIKVFLSYIKSVIKSTDPHKLKTKPETLLDRIKELSSNYNFLIKILESESLEEKTQSKMGEYMSSLKSIMKNMGLYSNEQVGVIFNMYRINKKEIIDSASRNDVTLTEELLEKINKKSLEISFATGIVTNNKADEIIIDLV